MWVVGDAPEFTVADGFVVVGAQGAVVAAGDDEVAGARCLGSGDTDRAQLVDVAAVAPEHLDGVVEGVDVLVGLGADGQPTSVEVVVEPGLGDGVEVVVDGAGDDLVVVEVGVERFGSPARSWRLAACSHSLRKRWMVASSRGRPVRQSSSNMPPRPTAWSWCGSPTRTSRQPWDTARPTRRSSDSVPSMPLSSTTSGRARREPVAGAGSARLEPLVEELGDGVGRHPGLRFEDTGGLGRRGDAEDRAPIAAEVGDGGPERGRLAGAGGTDDEDEAVVAGDGAGGVGLEWVEAVGLRRSGDGAGGGSWASMANVRMRSSWARTTFVGEVGLDRLDPHRTVRRWRGGRRRPRGRGRCGWRRPRPWLGRSRRPSRGPGRRATGRAVSQMALMMSMGSQVDFLALTWSRISSRSDGLVVVLGAAGDIVQVRHEALGAPAVVGRLGSPARRRARRAVVPVLSARESSEASRFSSARSRRVGSRPSRSRKVGELDVEEVVDLCGALREPLEELGGEAGDLGLAVDDLGPTGHRSGG